MRIIIIWIGRLLAAGAVLGAIAVGIGYYLASNSLPRYDLSVQDPALRAPVQIVRDANAVPHIFASTDEDALYSLGFAHAQDRLFQMLLMRRRVQGLLAEAYGPAFVDTDILVRSLDLYDHAGRVVEGLPPKTQALLQAYAEGVNGFLRLLRTQGMGRGAPELMFASNQIAPWTPQDSAALLALLALDLSDQMAREGLRARLRLLLDEARVVDLMPLPPEAVMALPEYAQNNSRPGPSPAQDSVPWREALREVELADPLPFGPPPVGFAGASNAWAALGARSASGGTLMASDPHLALSAPSQWYLARMELSTGPVIGATIPGLPAILMGRSPQLAWGFTASYLDDLDLYVERLDPTNPTQYEAPDGPVPFETRSEVIPIAGQAPRTEAFRATRHGPVLPAAYLGLDDITPPGHVIAVSWSALAPGDRTLEGMLEMMGAASVRDARR
ncbi:MAG: penicillin acylase family protein, partial [Pseudomonadota bacterium]